MSQKNRAQASLFSFGFNKNSPQSEQMSPSALRPVPAVKNTLVPASRMTLANSSSSGIDAPLVQAVSKLAEMSEERIRLAEMSVGGKCLAEMSEERNRLADRYDDGYTSSLSPAPSSLDVSSNVSKRGSRRASTHPIEEPPVKRVSLGHSGRSGRSSPFLESSPVLVPIPRASSDPNRIIKGSDDEDSGSDLGSGLSDLEELMKTQRPDGSQRPKAGVKPPLTPPKTKAMRSSRIYASPLAVLPKKKVYKFGLSDFVEFAGEEDAIEAYSKKNNVLKASPNGQLSDIANETSALKHDDLLESVVANTAKGEKGTHRIKRALERTEATNSELRFRFFEIAGKPPEMPFPKNIRTLWGCDIKDHQMRNHAFISGFAEDMITLQQTMPDDLFLWILDEVCVEKEDALRTSYCNALRQSHGQTTKLLTTERIRHIFRRLEGTVAGVDIKKRVRAVQELTNPYGNKRNWAKLRSVISLLGKMAKYLQQQAREVVIIMLLHMSADQAIFEEIDVYDTMQDSIFRICRSAPTDSWDTFCTKVAKSLIETCNQHTLQLQMVQTIPSLSPRTHDLKRRIAMTFFFKNLDYAGKHSFQTMNMHRFISRLHSQDFEATPDTNYRELGAMISLLDVAVDDGRSTDVDLKKDAVARAFDQEVEDLCSVLDNVMRNMHGPQAASVSKIYATEILQTVRQRIHDTVRSRPKVKQSIFDSVLNKESVQDLEIERKGMSLFLKVRK
ncbi:hypothetical protein BJ878DRAFT_538736 [Calycina marina]|uniref:Uncharacterized protein n=1 Tax=Calycina marina TaxID=1763456 RepID=A0A9P7ZAQ3_9HELO|nr:hypothetical protein BJ878DRAFT_538736 [Calycina marina]